VPAHPLAGLDSWVNEMAMEIILKCGGVPLALRALGSMYHANDSVDEWSAGFSSDIWELGDVGDQELASLRLSYLHLPPTKRASQLWSALLTVLFERSGDPQTRADWSMDSSSWLNFITRE